MKVKEFLLSIWYLLTNRSLKDNVKAVINLEVVIMIGIAFASLIVISFIIFTIQDQLITPTTSATVNSTLANITTGFDNAISSDRVNNRIGFINCIRDKIVTRCYHNIHPSIVYISSLNVKGQQVGRFL